MRCAGAGRVMLAKQLFGKLEVSARLSCCREEKFVVQCSLACHERRMRSRSS